MREDRARVVRYFHVELDRHDIILAEGLAAESYLDTGNRGLFENARVPLMLHPNLAADDGQARREALSCAPLATGAIEVEPVWRRLAMLARQLGHVLPDPATTSDPCLRVVVNGRELAAVEIVDDVHVFVFAAAGR